MLNPARFETPEFRSIARAYNRRFIAYTICQILFGGIIVAGLAYAILFTGLAP